LFVLLAWFCMAAEDAFFKLPIDGVLDLHTFHPADCNSLVPEYLQACREKNILQVRIIHGKGRGMLRKTVQHILELNASVLEFHQAPQDAGGRGATLVMLRPSALPQGSA
jgi:DNA-nicking Smr family endonuclease